MTLHAALTYVLTHFAHARTYHCFAAAHYEHVWRVVTCRVNGREVVKVALDTRLYQ